ncbi:hypothetical protein D7S86_08040 [Pararobbsia silviterrae]|uniref:Uncharacterized protein n=2 Tax=Pararobbsia silviterrae TaxID=1792498 RepID=A0A494Y6W5_9BURK|nr:hypothetical protein D7S86_08040 [Pararobbsia silviterrae]
MFGSGAAWSGVQAGDGAARPEHDMLADLARDPAVAAPIAAAGASEDGVAAATDAVVSVPERADTDTDAPPRAQVIREPVAHAKSVRLAQATSPATPYATANTTTCATACAATSPATSSATSSATSVPVTNTYIGTDPAGTASSSAPTVETLAYVTEPEDLADSASRDDAQPIAIEHANEHANDTRAATRIATTSTVTTNATSATNATNATNATTWTLATPAPLATPTPERKNDDRPPIEIVSAAPGPRDASGEWTEARVSDANLDTMRGGFDIGDGLQVAFGIERAVFVNGQLVTTTSFNIPNIAQMTVPQAQMLAQALGTTTVVQNGAGNVAPNVITGGAAATIVQNTLNNQTIKALTTINAAVNTLAQFKASNLQSTINSALATAAIPR